MELNISPPYLKKTQKQAGFSDIQTDKLFTEDCYLRTNVE
ncbi:MAG: hypothetical protein ACJAZJ_001415 [Candidatus Endobugula sp.]